MSQIYTYSPHGAFLTGRMERQPIPVDYATEIAPPEQYLDAAPVNGELYPYFDLVTKQWRLGKYSSPSEPSNIGEFGAELTRAEYFELFPLDMETAIRDASEGNTMIKTFLKRLENSETIRCQHPTTVQGLMYLQQQEILTAGQVERLKEGRPIAEQG